MLVNICFDYFENKINRIVVVNCTFIDNKNIKNKWNILNNLYIYIGKVVDSFF